MPGFPHVVGSQSLAVSHYGTDIDFLSCFVLPSSGKHQVVFRSPSILEYYLWVFPFCAHRVVSDRLCMIIDKHDSHLLIQVLVRTVPGLE
jgi:hypothetical protein